MLAKKMVQKAHRLLDGQVAFLKERVRQRRNTHIATLLAPTTEAVTQFGGRMCLLPHVHPAGGASYHLAD